MIQTVDIFWLCNIKIPSHPKLKLLQLGGIEFDKMHELKKNTVLLILHTRLKKPGNMSKINICGQYTIKQ